MCPAGSFVFHVWSLSVADRLHKRKATLDQYVNNDDRLVPEKCLQCLASFKHSCMAEIMLKQCAYLSMCVFAWFCVMYARARPEVWHKASPEIWLAPGDATAYSRWWQVDGFLASRLDHCASLQGNWPRDPGPVCLYEVLSYVKKEIQSYNKEAKRPQKIKTDCKEKQNDHKQTKKNYKDMKRVTKRG